MLRKPLSWFPSFLRFRAGTRLLEEAERPEDAVWLVEELWKGSGPALSKQMHPACVVVIWAVQQHMFDRLDWLATWAGELVLCVGGVESLGVLSRESVACDKTVESGVGEARELNELLFPSYLFRSSIYCTFRVEGEVGSTVRW